VLSPLGPPKGTAGHYELSTTFEYLRVARKLLGLPATASALEHGVLSWSDVGEITRVAEEETEADSVPSPLGPPEGTVETSPRSDPTGL